MSIKAYSAAEAEEFKLLVAQYVDVIGEKLGGKIVSFSDEWFAEASNLIKASNPVREAGRFTPAGAWYDGWETRRHNSEPADWVIIKLGVSSARIVAAEVDTAFFNGNHAPEISVEGAFAADDGKLHEAEWETIISTQPCGPSQRHFFLRESPTEATYTHVRLNMYPDGGIARFRLYGIPNPVFPEDIDAEVDLASVGLGGVAVAYSDQHFGSCDNLIIPGRGVDMGDGWETARSRTPGHTDWVIVRLAAPGHIDRVIVDTIHFFGNYPKYFKVEGLLAGHDDTIGSEDSRWKSVVPQTAAGPNKEHEFGLKDVAVSADDKFSHVKLTILPDGGVKRLRIFGRRAVNKELL